MSNKVNVEIKKALACLFIAVMSSVLTEAGNINPALQVNSLN